MRHHIGILVLLFTACSLEATTFVYNLRIRRVFYLPEQIPAVWQHKTSSLIGVPFVYGRDESHGALTHLAGGAILDGRHRFTPQWWAAARTAVFKEKARLKVDHHTQAHSMTSWDDFVLETGYNFFMGKPTQLIFYALAGFPTHRKLVLPQGLDQLVGTRTFSTGGAGEVSFPLIDCGSNSIYGVVIARLIHFFPISTTPLTFTQSKLHPGNATDVLVALHGRFTKHHVEIGYDGTFLTNQKIRIAKTTTPLPNDLRASVYGAYVYFSDCLPYTLGMGASRTFGNLAHYRAWIWWVSASVSF